MHMDFDLVGKINRMPLASTKGLLAVFEAIVNSLQALEEKHKSTSEPKYVEIHIRRAMLRQTDITGVKEKTPPPIIGFMVRDNGNGFDEPNFKSFKTASSRFKEKIGGKGQGRYLWLKVFKRAELKSVYSKKGRNYKREFSFILDQEPIVGNSNNSTDDHLRTEVELIDIQEPFFKQLQKKAQTIADDIIEHCLLYFLEDNCPKVYVYDDSLSEPINVNQRFYERIRIHSERISFKINDEEFRLDCLRRYQRKSSSHMLHFCANKREVKAIPFHNYLPDMKQCNLVDSDGNDFLFVAYLSGSFLDVSVNQERTSFHFWSEEDDDGLFSVKKADIIERVIQEIEERLKDPLGRIKEDKVSEMKDFVSSENPRYRPLLKYAMDDLSKIPAGLPPEKLDIELHKVLHQKEIELKEEGLDFINSIEKSDDYKGKYQCFLEKLKDFNRSKLADYVVHRKVIISLLEGSLRPNEKGYPKEEEVHRLIYPVRATSADAESFNQNLWLIDERLNYHRYLSSDLPLSRVDDVEIDSAERPDILILNSATAFVEGQYPYNSVVIVEIKRPERKNFTRAEDNPIEQCFRYIRKINSGTATDKRGEIIRVPKDTHFYCYVLADLNKKMIEFAWGASLDETFDGLGYRGWNKPHNAYVEVIGFRKLLEDAKKRNRALFDELGLPH